MTWFALGDLDTGWFTAPRENCQSANGANARAGPGALVPRGSLVIETRFPLLRRPKPLIRFQRAGKHPFQLSLQALPGGGLTLILDQGGEIQHHVFDHTDTGRADVLRMTYSWDFPRRFGRLALERSDQDHVDLLDAGTPGPIRAEDIEALVTPGEDRFIAPEVVFIAASTAVEPVGPMPTLATDTPIATPGGYRVARDLVRGDLVLNDHGESVPVLQVITRTVPARGGFAPLLLRAPFFGLKQDVTVAPSQQLVLSGSEVEYMFGHESVLIRAGHLAGGPSVLSAPPRRFASYTQLVLPEQDTLNAAGARAQSVYVGRIRRKPAHLAASLLAGFDRATLPEHGQSGFPVLKAFDAVMLADYRAA